jgi:hypothetical protein
MPNLEKILVNEVIGRCLRHLRLPETGESREIRAYSARLDYEDL